MMHFKILAYIVAAYGAASALLTLIALGSAQLGSSADSPAVLSIALAITIATGLILAGVTYLRSPRQESAQSVGVAAAFLFSVGVYYALRQIGAQQYAGPLIAFVSLGVGVLLYRLFLRPYASRVFSPHGQST